jgi:hypothetical protein
MSHRYAKFLVLNTLIISFSNITAYLVLTCPPFAFCYIPFVPKKLDIDWKAIEGLYALGMKEEVITSTYLININTLRSKIRRGNWEVKRGAIKQEANEIVEAKRVQTVANAGIAYQQRLVKHIEAGMDVLDSNLPTSRPEVAQHFDALGKVDKIAARAYGLESTVNAPQSAVLNLNFLKVDSAPTVIDVTPRISTSPEGSVPSDSV